ncbi:hypothetical protein ES703_114472 [subsurface metagenome]
MLYWLRDDCSANNDWCDGADLTFDGYVNSDDLDAFYECWLVEDTYPPVPNPSEWEIEPYPSWSPEHLNSISMAARTADDAWDFWVGHVQYYFDCVYGDGNDSGWQNDPNYIDPNLVIGTEYGYKVRARDASEQIPNDGTGEPGNKTEWSVIRYAIAGEEPPPLEDHEAPVPPPTISSYTATQDSITLFATTADDTTTGGHNPVEYYFREISGNIGGDDSSWLTAPTYTNSGLQVGTQYVYQVKARDTSFWQNETGWSDPFDATTLAEGEEPNEPNEPPLLQAPVIVSANQVEVGFYWHHIITAQATAEDPLYFRFVCLNQSIFNSAWVPRVGPAVETFDHPVLPFEMPYPTITRGSDVITYDIAVGVSWNLWQWQVCGSNDPSGVPSLCSAPVVMPQPF